MRDINNNDMRDRRAPLQPKANATMVIPNENDTKCKAADEV